MSKRMRWLMAAAVALALPACEVTMPDQVTYLNTGDQGHNSDQTNATSNDGGTTTTTPAPVVIPPPAE